MNKFILLLCFVSTFYSPVFATPIFSHGAPEIDVSLKPESYTRELAHDGQNQDSIENWLIGALPANVAGFLRLAMELGPPRYAIHFEATGPYRMIPLLGSPKKA